MTKANAWIAVASSVVIGCGAGRAALPPLTKLTILVGGNVAAPFGMTVGGQVRLAASVVDEDGQVVVASPLAWRSSGSSATVDASGMVRGVSVGTVYIKASSTTNGRVVADSVMVSVAGI